MQVEKNFLGLNQSQERLLLLLAEGNNQQEIACLLRLEYRKIRAAFDDIRRQLNAKTNEEAVAILMKDLCFHSNLPRGIEVTGKEHG